MHIPDGFLSTPVWASLDVAALPAVSYMARRAQRGFDDSKAPLLGVMGAFVFAAQMINFPVGAGTSGHLLGGALLAYTLGPAAASLTMTAILAIQALVFQDGGVLALGANVVNMAIAGVLASCAPYWLWGNGPRRKTAIFLGGALSVLVSATLALSELLVSGVPLPRSALGASVALFAIAAVVEGAITLAVIGAMEKIQPQFVRKPGAGRPRALAAAAAVAAVLATCGFLITSAAPDGIWSLANRNGFASRARQMYSTPFTDYHLSFLRAPWQAKALAGAAGLVAVYLACTAIGRAVARARRT